MPHDIRTVEFYEAALEYSDIQLRRALEEIVRLRAERSPRGRQA